jgi:hypothetical protein
MPIATRPKAERQNPVVCRVAVGSLAALDAPSGRRPAAKARRSILMSLQ